MHLTRLVRGNLNRRHWNRRAWEIGYKGPLLPQQKATGRPDYPISGNAVDVLRERLAREWNVMKMLVTPYVDKKMEADYFASRSVTSLDDIRDAEEHMNKASRMPGKAKRVEGSKLAVRRRGNVGNLLHEHQTVEAALSSLKSRNRWD